METINTERIVAISSSAGRIDEQLNQVFGSYRAEGLKERIFDLFSEPNYFAKLISPHTCLLMGGRGTGKTTVLRLLGYEGQFARSGRDPQLVPTWSYYGLYHRINLNRVDNFQGPELTEQRWERVFAHYLNLVLCNLISEFLLWYTERTGQSTELNESGYHRISLSLHLAPCNTNQELARQLDEARIQFEAYINNVGEERNFALSMQGAPVDVFSEEALKLSPFQGKTFYFILDEYENLLAYQQRIMNTLIKHSGTLYTFKVGVKEEGIKTKETLTAGEKLETPADYDLVGINEQLEGGFEAFARKICNERLAQLRQNGVSLLGDIKDLLPQLSDEEEAIKLGAKEQVAELRRELTPQFSAEELTAFDSLTPLEAYFLKFWSDGKKVPSYQIVREYLGETTSWQLRYGNYKYACLFALGRKKTDIKKYYAGWKVFTLLADTNIRRLLQLVDQSLFLHTKEGNKLDTSVMPEVQTRSAVRVAEHNLSELEGITSEGAHLKRLILGLGKIFHVMAEDAAGHAPEVNQFQVRYASGMQIPTAEYARTSQIAEQLLKSAIMHLALQRSHGTKLNDDETMEYDYFIHPIFCPFFVFSHRRKRKMRLTEADLAGLVTDPAPTISKLLRQHKRGYDEANSDPLGLFEEF